MAKMKKMRIGSRASRLALLQAKNLAQRLRQLHNLGAEDIAIIPISTRGDQIRETPLWEMGGKGLFTERMEAALLEGSLDVAVHSMKDMPTKTTPGLRADVMLERQDARDVLIISPLAQGAEADTPIPVGIHALPHGCRLGSSAPRRMAQILWQRPDVRIVPLRGNVETRLEKLASGVMDATLLARAGLQRLGLAPDLSATLSIEEMLPAAGQGAIVAQYREDDPATRAMLTPAHHHETGLRVTAEKAFLETLNGSCTTAAGAFAEFQGAGKKRLVFTGRLLAMDGSEMREIHQQSDVEADMGAAIALGRRAGETLLRQKPRHRPQTCS